jgi:plasmid segregation protein ParM
MLIAIDHGNKQIKCMHRTFTSGLAERDTRPPFGENVLKYRGRYYTLSERRILYMRDKSVDERFFILTLFAIAYEIIEERVDSSDVIDIQLAVGLPPAHYGAQYERFERYLKQEGSIVNFEFGEKSYSIYISEVVSYPQAYAAAMPVFNQISNIPKVTVIDIGGFTVDYLQIKKGRADLSACDSLENGVITLYNSIKSKVSTDYDFLLDESDIDTILEGETRAYNPAISMTVENQVQIFVTDLFGMLRERMIDLKNGQIIFVGGGSILLRKYIESFGKVGHAVFVDEINANARGYELLYRASMSGR